MVFPPVYLNVLEGIGRADGKLLEMAKVFRVPGGGRRWGFTCRGAALLPLGGVAVSGALLEGWGGGGGDRTARRHHRRAAVYRQGVLRDRGLFAWTAVIVAVSVGFEKLFLRAVDALTERVVSP